MKSLSFENDVLQIGIKSFGESKILKLSREDYEKQVEEILDVKYEDSKIYSSRYYEVAIARAAEIPSANLASIEIADESSSTVFKMSRASKTFFWYYISLIKGPDSSLANFLNFEYDYELDDFEGTSLLDFLYQHKFYLSTAKLESNSNRSTTFFEELLDSYSYILSYQLNSTFRVVDSFSSGRKSRTKLPNRVESISEIIPPRRKYNKTLVLYYTRSIASPDASSKFLSLYHILEHEYDKVTREETVRYVASTIGSAGFSYKNHANVDNLISEIVKRVKENPYNSDEIVSFTEAAALKLLVLKYIGTRSELSRLLGRDLIKYYGENGISFCGVGRLDLSKDDESVCDSVAKRIYATRNAIVHSKSANPNKFIPYKNDTELSMEIFLLRVIAEKIIEANASDF